MRIIDNFLEEDVLEDILSVVEADDFPWEKSLILKDPPAGLHPADNVQWVHGFYLRNRRLCYESRHFGLLLPILEKLGPKSLIKIKLNRTPGKDRNMEFGMHVDTQREGATTAIFYLNSNNGSTLFADGTRVASVRNRLVLFPASLAHCGVSCSDAPFRWVMNFNVFLEPAGITPSV